MKILIIGAFGMIGKYLVKEFSDANHTVLAAGRNVPGKSPFDKNVSLINIDITKPETFDNVKDTDPPEQEDRHSKKQ